MNKNKNLLWAGEETPNTQSPTKPNFIDTTTGEVNIFGVLDETVMTEVIPGLRMLATNCQYVCPERRAITININSRGGELSVLFSILSCLDEAKKYGAIITTNVLGDASSAASLLACCGTKGYRFVNPYGAHLVHHLRAANYVSTAGEIENNHKACKYYSDMMKKLYLDNTKISSKEYDKMTASDGYIVGAKEAIKLGMADKIIGA